jgi:hypothetical protein
MLYTHAFNQGYPKYIAQHSVRLTFAVCTSLIDQQYSLKLLNHPTKQHHHHHQITKSSHSINQAAPTKQQHVTQHSRARQLQRPGRARQQTCQVDCRGCRCALLLLLLQHQVRHLQVVPADADVCWPLRYVCVLQP